MPVYRRVFTKNPLVTNLPSNKKAPEVPGLFYGLFVWFIEQRSYPNGSSGLLPAV